MPFVDISHSDKAINVQISSSVNIKELRLLKLLRGKEKLNRKVFYRKDGGACYESSWQG